MRDLSLFRDRRFVLLFAARTLAVLGGAFGPVALAFGVLGLPGATATTLTIVLTAQAVPEILFMLFAGVIADRMPRNRLMMIAELMSAASFGALAVMFITGWAPLPLILLSAAAAGISIAMFYPALTGIVPDVVAADKLQTANGLLRLGINSSRLLGFALAGAAVALLGSGWALAVNAGTLLVSASLYAALRLPATARAVTTNMIADLREGWREFVSRQWLWAIVLQFSFVVAALQATMGVLGPVVAKEDLGGAPAWSAIMAGHALGTLVGVVVSIRIRPKRPLLVATLAVFPTTAPFILLGVGAPLWVVVVGGFAMGVSFDIFGVLWETTMQREIPTESLSRVASYDALGSFMFGPIGLLAAGPLASTIGARPALLAWSGVVIVATAAALLSPQVRRLRAPVAAAGVAAATMAPTPATPTPAPAPAAASS